jgi:hypothetical protein
MLSRTLFSDSVDVGRVVIPMRGLVELLELWMVVAAGTTITHVCRAGVLFLW